MNTYGHHFHGNRIIVISVPQETAFSVQEACRRKPAPFSVPAEINHESLPDEIYFHTEETWYSLRFHVVSSENGMLSFLIHGMKSMYMAEEELSAFDLKYDHSSVLLYIRMPDPDQ